MRTVLVFTKGTSVEKLTWEILDFRIDKKESRKGFGFWCRSKPERRNA